MKKNLILLLVLLPFSLFSQTKSVLFLGNSYSYYNGGVSLMISEIASSLQDTLVFDENFMGGATFQGHSVNATSLSKIAAQPWDYVVLQEQSQLPSFPPAQVAAEVYPYAQILCDSIFSNDTCTTPLFFMTWGRENGDQANCEYYEPLCTYEGMQLELRKSYLQMAEDNDGSVAPVGMVWKAIREDFPEIDLYSTDGSHPALAGTFLASNVLYTSIFQNSPVGGYIPDGISAENALHMQEYAANIVFDSLDIWRIDTTNVRAHFIPEMLVGKSTWAYFVNLSENAEYAVWDFGDGLEEYVQNNLMAEVIYEFSEEGEYTVCMTAWKGCQSDTYCEIVHTDFFQSDAVHGSDDKIAVYGETLKFPHSMLGERVWIYDVNGRLLDTRKIRSERFDLSVYSGLVYVKHSSGTTKILLN